MIYKILFLSLLLVSLTICSFSQTKVPEDLPDSLKNKAKNGETRFTIVEESAQFEGGMIGFYDYVKKNIKLPKSVRRGKIKGRVIVEFVVVEDGSIDLETLKSIKSKDLPKTFSYEDAIDDEDCHREAIRLIKESPTWKPAKQKGIPVKQRIRLPILFRK